MKIHRVAGSCVVAISSLTGCIGGLAYDLKSNPVAGAAAWGQTCPTCPLLTGQLPDSSGLWNYDPANGEQFAAPTNGEEATHFIVGIMGTSLVYDVYHTPSWFLYNGQNISAASTTYFPTGVSSAVDTDADGLPDVVETSVYFTDPNKKDTDGDGVGDGAEVLGLDWVDYRHWGANPLHKDVFVEVDYEEYTDTNGILRTWKPGDALVAKITAFYAGLGIQNPDGIQGINIHFDFDQTLPKGTTCSRQGLWGAPFNPRHEAGFHYFYFAEGDNINYGGKTAVTDEHGTLITGRSYDCGPEPDHDPSNDQTEDAQYIYYSNFIHEMGHSLGLGHGGFDNTNCKPNYPSVMNYAFEFYFNGDNQTLRGTQLQYSPGGLPGLTETSLQERNSFPNVPLSSVAYLSQASQRWPIQADSNNNNNLLVDWNKDGNYAPGTISQFIRNDGGNGNCPNTGTPSPNRLDDNNDIATIERLLPTMVAGAGASGVRLTASAQTASAQTASPTDSASAHRMLLSGATPQTAPQAALDLLVKIESQKTAAAAATTAQSRLAQKLQALSAAGFDLSNLECSGTGVRRVHPAKAP